MARGENGLTPLAAAAVTLSVLTAETWVGRRNAPAPFHPRVARWYRRLRKPGFTPPDPVFGAVWPILETSMAIGGYRLLRRPRSSARDAAVLLWIASSAAIGGWTELFFRRHLLGSSAAAAATMTAGTMALVAVAWKEDRIAAVTAMPLAAWLGFATLLSEEVWRGNARSTSYERVTG